MGINLSAVQVKGNINKKKRQLYTFVSIIRVDLQVHKTTPTRAFCFIYMYQWTLFTNIGVSYTV